MYTKIKGSFRTLALSALALLMIEKAQAQQADSTKITIADIRTIHSKILNEDRKIYIYKRSDNQVYLRGALPVLYLMDAESHLGMVGTMTQYAASYGELPNMLVVGIGNYSYDRMRDLTPTHSNFISPGNYDSSASSPFRTTGGGDKFLRFVKEEVMPYIDSLYHPAPYRVLSGHSLGGLMALYCMSSQPNLFNAYMAISPSLWWDDNREVRRASQSAFDITGPTKFVFMSDGSEGGSFHTSVLSYDSIVKRRNPAGLRYKYVYYPGESHGSEPIKAEYDALRFIFAGWKPQASDTSAALIQKFYAQLSTDCGYTMLPQEEFVNTMGYTVLATKGRIKDAIDLFEMNVRNYPSSFNVYDSLGDAYAQAGDKEKAIANYKKALELNAGSTDTKRKLQKLQR